MLLTLLFHLRRAVLLQPSFLFYSTIQLDEQFLVFYTQAKHSILKIFSFNFPRRHLFVAQLQRFSGLLMHFSFFIESLFGLLQFKGEFLSKAVDNSPFGELGAQASVNCPEGNRSCVAARSIKVGGLVIGKHLRLCVIIIL
jgi:hypothetical protein